MPNPRPKYPGESTVAIRIPRRFAYAIEEIIVPHLMKALPDGGGVAHVSMIVNNVSALRHYKLRGQIVVRWDDVQAHAESVPFWTRKAYVERYGAPDEEPDGGLR